MSLAFLFLRVEFWLALIGMGVALGIVAWRGRLRRRFAWFLRLFFAGLILAALFTPKVDAAEKQGGQRQVMVLDQSDSVDEAARLEGWRQALEWQGADSKRILVVFGDEARVALPSAVENAERLPPQIDGRAGDLPEALALAGELLAGEPGQIVLLSDGIVHQPLQTDAAVNVLVEAGHRLDTAALATRAGQNDIAVGALIAPANLWSGTGFDLIVPVLGDTAGSAALTLTINGEPSNISAEPAGGGAYRFRIPELPEGIVTLQVTAGAAGEEVAADPFPGNNQSFTILQVFPPPRVMFVSATPDVESVRRFTALLAQEGIQVEPATPDRLPTNLDTLEDFRVIFLHNILSSQITREQMTAMQVFASQQAGGLIFLGGQNSYTLGGYKDTLVEPMLPVLLEPPPRSERPPLLFQLVLDRSASMNTGLLQDVQPIALAREAAMRSIETLRETDYLGVLTFSDTASWDFPLQPLTGATTFRQALDAVSQVQANGGTYLFQSMQDALVGMVSLPPDAPSNRHMLILTDGQSTDGDPAGFHALAEAALAQGITVSTIALGPDADKALLEDIATTAKGRFYSVEDAEDLPHIMISESEAARSENVQSGETSLRIGESGHPVLFGLAAEQLPMLSAYNALSSRIEEGAEDILVSASFEDPILSSWQYGLGRVTAWMGDIGEQWTADWPDDGAEGRFWSQIVRYSLVNPALNPAQVNVTVEPARVRVEAAIFTTDGEPLNLADATFTYADANGETHSFRLAQESAGVYTLEIPRPDDGAYRALVTFADEDGNNIEAPAPFAVNPPEEWLPMEATQGLARLNSLAEAGGGKVTTIEEVLQPADLPTAVTPQLFDTWPERLLLALVIFWPVEIAIRRRWLPWV